MKSPSCEKNTDLKKGSWSLEEDQKLISYINRYGIWNWSQMARFAGLSRSGKSCRLRWMNYLRPNLKRGNFSKAEEDIILRSHSLIGNRWSAIASQLPGRTDNEVKNHWHTHLKKRANNNDHNLTLKNKQNDMNKTTTFEDVSFEKMQPADDVDDILKSFLTSEDYCSSSICRTKSKDHVVDFGAECYEMGPPGMVGDLQCFGEQLRSFEEFELGDNHLDFFYEQLYQDSNDPVVVRETT